MTLAPAEAEKSTRSVAVVRGAFQVPGFRVGAASTGMRYRDRLDFAAVVSDHPVSAAGVFTQNRFAAAPVRLCRARLERHAAGIRAVVANAGIANACTGEEGLRRAESMATLAAEALGLQPEAVLVASTGVIGPQIRLEPIREALPELAQSLRPDGWEDAASAIMTTDTRPKTAHTRLSFGGSEFTVGGIAKGSGMIAPDMATLLAFVATDAPMSVEVLRHWLRAGAERSFNRITVDGDTSTNDTLIALAGATAAHPVIRDPLSPEGRCFGEALTAVLLDLARQVVLDGEGATKFVALQVIGAPDAESAKKVAFTVANSPLVKTAFFGGDANWGRIIAAAGRAGVPLNPDRVSLTFGNVCVFRNGAPLDGEDLEARATEVFRGKAIDIRLDLGVGTAEETVYTCDLSYDYVKINGAYRT